MEKQCTHCNQTKEYSSFYKRKRFEEYKGSAGYQATCKACYRAKQVAHRYDLTEDQYLHLLKAQSGKCATCLGKFAKTPHIDHSHQTGKTRRLLCGACNVALGLIKDNIETLTNMIMYIDFFSESAATNTDTANTLEKVG